MNRSSMPKQVMTFSNGGLASFIPRQTQIAGQPHMLAYINPQEEALLRDFGGSGIAGPAGIPSYPPDSAVAADYGFSTDSQDRGMTSTGVGSQAGNSGADDNDGGGWSWSESSFNPANWGGDSSSGGRNFDADMSAGSARVYSSQDDTYTSGAGALPRDVGLVNSLLMGAGLKDKTAAYYSASADTIARTSGAAAAAQYIDRMNAKGNISDADAAALRASTSFTGKDYDDRMAAGYGDDGDSLSGSDQTDGEEGDDDKKDDSPNFLPLRFFGGYTPTSRSDVLVPSSFRDGKGDGTYRPLPILHDGKSFDGWLDFYNRQNPDHPDYDPNFLGGGFDYGDGGFTPGLISDPKTVDMGMNYGGGALAQAPAVDPMVQKRLDHMRGIAALLGEQPATEAMYQGIMS